MTPEEIRQIPIGYEPIDIFIPEEGKHRLLLLQGLAIAREHCAQAALANELKEMELRGEAPASDDAVAEVRYQVRWHDSMQGECQLTYFADGNATQARLDAIGMLDNLRDGGRSAEITLRKVVSRITLEPWTEAR